MESEYIATSDEGATIQFKFNFSPAIVLVCH